MVQNLFNARSTMTVVDGLMPPRVDKKKPRHEPEDETDPAVLEKLTPEQQCKVCYDRAKIAVAKPCQHLALCKTCAKHVMEQNRKCPICNELVDVFEYIFSA
jgi:hypothetical protein